MALRTGITTSTPGNLFLGAGTLTVGGNAVGATSGNTTFTVTKEIVTPELVGAGGPVAQTEFVRSEIAQLSMQLVEVTIDNLVTALPGTTKTSDANSEQISAGTLDALGASDYQQVVWTGNDYDGNNITITLENAIMVDDLEITFSDTEVAVYNVTYQARYSLSDPDARPYSIVINL